VVVEEMPADEAGAEEGAEVLPEPESAPVEELAGGDIGARPSEDVPPWGTPGAMSIRVRRNKEAAAREEAERKRRAAIEDAHAKDFAGTGYDLGSVDVDFVPEPDPEV